MSAALKTAETLTPEALAFIKEGTPRPRTETPVVSAPERFSVPQPVPSEDTPQSITEPLKVTKRKVTPQEEAVPGAAGVVGLTFRLPVEIHHALMRASFERKFKRQKPWTQQEIAAEALSAWLKKSGYL